MTPSDDELFAAQRSRVEFPLTHWTEVLTAANPAAPLAGEALERLCRTYWLPVCRFIGHQGHGREDAQDLTQEFFAGFLEKEHVKRADPARGRFRAFLLTSLKNFIANGSVRARAQKRGDGLFVSLDQPNEAEAYWLAQVPDPGVTPDLAYEKQWATALLDHVFAVLRQQSAAAGGSERYETLLDLAMGDSAAGRQVEIAAQLGMTPNALGVAVHRLRRRYAERLRAAVAQTVANPDEIEAELHYLLAVLSA